ncbi:DoxX family protein [Flagellimonas halotolerans]|uniref:DoxX family protein n=1 Tax=Flagellimonas halotolerans TaxID=3112164 RepID=A0ABU6IL40_9FLAO|nr:MULTISPECIES: DoxX family protein [unclassified Allomuricauda]MEC3963948.1 DoxX family protein [Muricauda sp. SYSU M86414]MEC4263818.1 DoxX family protein [Muricauda sp. SYSU M84420]
MDNLLFNATEVLLLIFLTITFLQSGIDKLLDWKGNLGWLTEHFSKSIFKGTVPVLLSIVLVLELLSGILCGISILQFAINGESAFAFYGATISAATLLMLLLGQRVAKDYVGAQTIVVYLIPTLFLVYLMQ